MSRMRCKSVPNCGRAITTDSHSFERNATTSPLLRLPAEIRNEIFSYAMSNSTITIAHTVATHNQSIPSKGFYNPRPYPAASLLFVCRQIYSEIAILPYALNKFVVLTTRLRDLQVFLDRRTQEQVELMRDVSWEFNLPNSNTTAMGSTFCAKCWLEWLKNDTNNSR